MENLSGFITTEDKRETPCNYPVYVNTSFFSVLLSIISLFHQKFISGTAERYLFLMLCRKSSSCALKNTNILPEAGVL